MKITLKCYATLLDLTPAAPVDMPDGTTIDELMTATGVDAKEVKLIFRNGLHAKPEDHLADGDSIGLFPPIGGG
ncbi:MoaD/ThiS family protein [Desulfovibrio inopinatus]|uniref:MoaD/ThiS family protein n=1 Tax=Desulfovibrio inopinatus TaxID=102109 RepID=UPI00040E6CC9|nr:MoaD/ThiS family protein [Desulfovibrio inopinatus]